MDNKALTFGYGYAVVDAKGNINKYTAIDSQEIVSILVRTKKDLVERYTGNIGYLWAWCNDRGLECKTYRLQAIETVPDDAKEVVSEGVILASCMG